MPRPPRPDPRRITALSIALAAHVALALALVLPVAPLQPRLQEVPAVMVGFLRRDAPPPPPPPPRDAPRTPPAPAPAAAPRPAEAGTEAMDPATEAPGWTFDPDAGVTLVVYGERPELELERYDVPPAELPQFRGGFDPAAVPGLDAPDSSGSATFEVLVEPDGRPSALVIRRQACSERALEAAMAVIGQWTFAPATRAGVPVQAWLDVTLDF